ncbi:MAG: hypothetical protein U0P28_09365, partial [Ruminococcus sp.]
IYKSRLDLLYLKGLGGTFLAQRADDPIGNQTRRSSWDGTHETMERTSGGQSENPVTKAAGLSK